jgi:cytochrome c-type biogenesis protein CcmH/NrfG
MTVSNIQPQSTLSQAAPSLHGLRNALEQAERQIVRLDRTNIQSFLVGMDQIEQMWTGFDDPGSQRSEEARWQSLLKRISTSPQLITSTASQVGGMTKLRSQNPPATGMWWHVDEQVAGQRQQIGRRLLVIAGIVVVVVLAFWLFNKFMARNTAAADPSQQIDTLVEAHNWNGALTVVKDALQKSPGDANLLIWQAVLQEQLNDKAQAQASLTQAQAKFAGSPAAFWTLVGNLRLQAGNWDGAEESGQKALALTPKDGEVTFLLGRVAEARGDTAKASDYYNQTIVLAGDSNPALVATVKVRQGLLMQSLPPQPGPVPTPGVTQTVTP